MNRALMAAGLVDRVQVTLFSVITGQTGLDPIFQGAADFDLELVESRTLDGHFQEHINRPAGQATVNGGTREPAAQDRCCVVRTWAGPVIGAVAASVAVVTTSPTEASGAAAGVPSRAWPPPPR